jgi:hypothetical protein
MANLDVSKDWIILAQPSVRDQAAELALYISLLRGKAGLARERPEITEAAAVSHAPAYRIIIKAAAGGLATGHSQNGFSWQVGRNKIEIYGDSPRGLWNGIFDFLAAAGIKWPAPDQEELPQAGSGSNKTAFNLKIDKALFYSISSAQDRRRLFIDEKTGAKEREKLVKWAARNKYDALVFSLREKSFWARAKPQRGSRIYGADRYALALEAGGCDLSLLLPRRLFLFHRNLFRMELGSRTANFHFCTTNPDTISRIKKNAGKLFSRALPGMTVPRVFHFLPDQGHENTWCACPACRAFSPAEQYIIAVNSAADALESIDLRALVSFFDFGIAAGETVTSGITARKNMFSSREIRGQS